MVNPANAELLVVFLGRKTLQKLYLILHLGRMLQCAHDVRLDTVNPSVDDQTIYDYCGLEIHEYPDSEALQSELGILDPVDINGQGKIPHGANEQDNSPLGAKEQGNVPDDRNPSSDSGNHSMDAKPHIHLVDLSESAVLPLKGHCFLVTDSDRNSLEDAVAAVQAIGSAASSGFLIHRIYLDIYEGARIGIRYLEEMISRKLPHHVEPGELLALYADERNGAAIIDNQHDDRLRLSGLTTEYRRVLADVAKIGFKLTVKESRRFIRLADRRK